jgi:putative phosphoribosyl transferase
MDGYLDGSWGPHAGGRYINRYDAGRALAHALKDIVPSWSGTGVVVGLPRGGIAVARAVANDLKLTLDFRAVRKIGFPGHEEFAIGAVDISGLVIKNPDLTASELPIESEFNRLAKKALDRAIEIDRELRVGKPNLITGADWCLVVDDGIATGLTILAVTKALKSEGKIVHIAVPVSSIDAKMMLSRVADSVLALQSPEYFVAVGQYYDDFSEVTTEEARRML